MIADPLPDANTLWDFREALIRAGALDALLKRLDRAIEAAGYPAAPATYRTIGCRVSLVDIEHHLAA